jgi:hypothetical protein
MKLTPEQEAQIARERATEPGKTSFLIEPTADQDAEMARAIVEEEAGRAENIARCRRLEELLREDTLLGALRRAIEADDASYDELASKSGLSADALRNFHWGDGGLTSDEIDRLAGALRMHLVPEASAT